jgi:hypothetical protein
LLYRKKIVEEDSENESNESEESEEELEEKKSEKNLPEKNRVPSLYLFLF